MKPEHKKRYKLLACEIFYREICLLAARCPNIIDVESLPKGLHDIGQEHQVEHLSGGGGGVFPEGDLRA